MIDYYSYMSREKFIKFKMISVWMRWFESFKVWTQSWLYS